MSTSVSSPSEQNSQNFCRTGFSSLVESLWTGVSSPRKLPRQACPQQSPNCPNRWAMFGLRIDIELERPLAS